MTTDTQEPTIIAEMSGNHNQSLDRALAIVDAAAEAGAHAVKLQTYTADTMTLPLRTGDFLITDPASPWRGRTLHDLYNEAHTPWDWHQPIFERCRQHRIQYLSTPFDATAVDFLEQLDVAAYKIASFEITDLPLIRKVAQTGKPLILSTGMATLSEIADAVQTARAEGNHHITLLKCTSTYPATPETTNLLTIPILRAAFNTHVGLSDHTHGIGAAIASIALGATLSRNTSPSPERWRSRRRLLPRTPRTQDPRRRNPARLRALGTTHFGPTTSRTRLPPLPTLPIRHQEHKSRATTFHGQRSRYRPGVGLSPKHLTTVLGMKIDRDAEGTPLTWGLLRWTAQLEEPD